MSHEDNHAAQGIAKIVRMANQIGTFFESKPHEEGVHGVAEHINKFWEPRMRRHFFERGGRRRRRAEADRDRGGGAGQAADRARDCGAGR